MHRPRESPSRTYNPVGVAFLIFAAVLVGALAFVLITRLLEKRDIARGVSNCRQIITALRIYSSDHGGGYMDNHRVGPEENRPRSSNEDFRLLFKEQILADERIFGCPRSPYVPDGNVGEGGSYLEALAPEENHWMKTHGLSDSASGSVPLVYENAEVAKWNPEWNADAKGKRVPGRTWSGGIIVGMNDSSVSLQRLASDHGSAVPLKELSTTPDEGDTLFTQHGFDWEVLGVER